MGYEKGTMNKRLGWASLALGIVTTAACGGDDPQGSVDPGSDGPSATPDGGEAGTPPATLQPRVEIKVDPVVVVRGQTARIPVQVFRVDTASAITIELQNAPAGTTASAPLTLAANLSSGELTLATADAASYGDYALQITATAPDLPAPVTFQVPLQVRGVPGALDTSFGTGGSAPVTPNGAIGDVLVDSAGRYVIAGGYNAADQNMLMARLTPGGQMDPTFGVAGLRRWNAPYGHIGHFEMRPGYYRRALREIDGGYALTAYLEPGTTNTNVVVHHELSSAGAEPTYVPPTAPAGDLGSINGGTGVIRDGDGFFLFRRGCKVERRLAHNDLDPSFGVGGIVTLTSTACFVADAMDTPDAIVLVLTANEGGANRRLVTLARNDGTNLDPTSPVEPGVDPVHLSRPGPTGKVLATYGTTVREVSVHDGAATTTLLKGSRFGGALEPAIAKSSLAFYFPDGTIGAITFGTTPVFHRLAPDGENLAAVSGVALAEPDFARFGSIVEAYPDARGGLVLVYPSATNETFEHWTIKRFWL